MITRASRVLLVFLLLIASLTASVADSAKDMLAAGRIDEAIAELNGRISSAPADAESSNLLCRAYFALGDWDRAESSCRKAVSLSQTTAVSTFGWGACTAKRRIGQIFWPRRAWPERSAGNSSVPCNWIRKTWMPGSIWRSSILLRPASSAAASRRPASKRSRLQL